TCRAPPFHLLRGCDSMASDKRTDASGAAAARWLPVLIMASWLATGCGGTHRAPTNPAGAGGGDNVGAPGGGGDGDGGSVGAGGATASGAGGAGGNATGGAAAGGVTGAADAGAKDASATADGGDAATAPVVDPAATLAIMRRVADYELTRF